MFQIKDSPETIKGSDFEIIAEKSKMLFKNPDSYIKRIAQLVNTGN